LPNGNAAPYALREDAEETMNATSAGFVQAVNDEALALGTDPVPAKPYYDPAYFELERDAVFRRSWLQIGHVCELTEPGDFIRRELEVLGVSVLVTRSKDGSLRAFHNVCTHRGTQLVDDDAGRASKFSCPYHRWTFGNDGVLLSAPDFERFYVEKADCNLKAITLDTCGDLIFVNLDPDPPQPLRAWLGEAIATQLDDLTIARATHFSEYVYDIDANWKLTYDNFQENYHLRFIHPNSGAATSGKDNPFGYPLRYDFHGIHRAQTIWTNPEPKITPTQGLAFMRAMATAGPDAAAAAQGTKQYFALFPSLFLFGSAIQPFSHIVYPISATRSRGVIRLYWAGADDSASKRFAREYMMATTRDIHAEDVSVIEAGQRGLSSGALTHIHFQEQEVLCRHLFLSMDAKVRAYQARSSG
jgi:phenylpropionate dioxygenase-like ring-hydroxylating dioxygenase large terminal subunit